MAEYDVQFESKTPKKSGAKSDPAELPKKQIRTVTKNPARTQKKSGVKKLTDAFIAEDVSNIKNYIVKDILIPAVKKGIVDVITNSVDMLFYGEAGRSNRNRGGRMSYNSIYNNGNSRPSPRTESYVNDKTPYDRQIVDTLQEAKDAIAQLNEILQVYPSACIADYYEMIQVTAESTDYNYGWTEFIDPEYVRVPDGWMIKMPKAHPLARR